MTSASVCASSRVVQMPASASASSQMPPPGNSTASGSAQPPQFGPWALP